MTTLAALVVLAPIASASAGAPLERPARLIDGDTFVRPSGEIIRIDGADAPEADWRASCPKERVLSARATAVAATLLADGYRLFPTGVDPYGRTLAYIKLRSGASFSAEMTAQGLMSPWRGRNADWCAP